MLGSGESKAKEIERDTAHAGLPRPQRDTKTFSKVNLSPGKLTFGYDGLESILTVSNGPKHGTGGRRVGAGGAGVPRDQ